MKHCIKYIFLFFFLMSCLQVQAQRSKKKKKSIVTKKVTTSSNINQPITGVVLDTVKPNVLTITSTFKPFLRSASKINFTASMPILDTNRLSLAYSIPAQNLFFTYQPVPIKPIAYFAENTFKWVNSNYIKLGFGNYAQPYAEAAISFGSPESNIYSIIAKYHQAKGNLLYQETTQALLKATAEINSISNHDLVVSVGYSGSAQNRYGTNPNLVFTKDQLKQNFNTIQADVQLHSKAASEFGIQYHPNLKANVFSDHQQGTEFNALLQAPFSKSISKKLSVDLGILADLSFYKNNNLSISNNVFSIKPQLKFTGDDLLISAAIQPTWNNNELEILPDVQATYHLAKEKFMVIGGYKSFLQKNTYQSLAAINPFLDQPKEFKNSITNEIFGGLKGAVGKHFSFLGKLSFIKTNQQVLFANDTAQSKSQNFNILYEPDVKSIRLSGEVSYVDQNKFSLITGVSFTQFTAQEKYDKVYGFLPLEINSSIRYYVLKDVVLKSDIYIWDGAYYRIKNDVSGKSKMVVDLNVGTEVKVLKNTYFYLELNNLFNNEYQRWNQYNVFGFNVVGGVVYSFN